MQTKQYDIAIVGGGIIGLATGMRLAKEFPNLKTVVLEKESKVAQHQTGHNSGYLLRSGLTKSQLLCRGWTATPSILR